MGSKNVKLSTIVHPTPVARAVLACLAAFPATGLAAPCLAPPAICLSNDGFDWRTDRFTPDNVEMLPSHQGGTNVTHIQMGPNGFFTAPARANFQTRFYDTQGVSAVTNLPDGPAFLSGSVFISSAMQAAQTATLGTHDTGNFVRFGLWGEAFGPAHPPAFPIITFTNINGPGRIEIFDDVNGGYVSVEVPINYDGWNRVEARFTGTTYEFLVNGVVVLTMTGRDANALTDQLRTVFLNSVNNNTSPYDVYWDTILAGTLIEPGAPVPAAATNSLLFKGGTTALQGNTTINGALVADTGSTVAIGAGATLAASGLLVAAGGSTLSIADGGTAQSAGGTIGLSSAGTATITGSGSAWTSSADITVGSAEGGTPGAGTLNIAENGVVSVAGGSGRVILGATFPGSLQAAAAASTSGTVNIGTGGAPGILNAAEVSTGGGAGTLNFNHSQAPYYFTKDGTAGGAAVLISGSTSVHQIGPGTTVFTRDNTYTGGTTISNGTLQLGNGGTTGSILGDVNNNGTLVFNRSNAQAFGGVISGSGSVTKLNGSTLTLTGANTYTGGTTISGGTLEISQDTNLGATGGALTFNGGALRTTADVATARATTLDSGGGTIETQSGTLTHTGTLAGPGALVKTGIGTLVLGADNTYTGGTTINAGTLQLGNGGTIGSILGDVNNNGTLVFNRSNAQAFGGVISGSGSVTKLNGSTLTLTGANTYTGGTFIEAGTLRVDGHQPNSAVTVSNTGRLAGNGTVGATTLNSGGTVAPGASIGTLTVNGAYAQNAGSVYEVEVDPNTDQSDRIVVNGAATVASGAAIAVSKVNPSAYRIGTRYTVLTTTGGLTGTYALTGDLTLSALESLVSVYDANNAYLLVASTDLSALATTPNQKAIAAALQSLPAGSALVGAIAALPDPASAEAAFDALSGEMHASVKTVLLDDSRYVRETANDRMRQAFCAGAVGNVGITAQQQEGGGACRPDRRGAWGRLFGVTGEMDGDSNVARLHHSTSGVLVGADAPVADTWRAGVLAGYQQSHFDQDPRGSSGSGDNYNLGVYGGSQWGQLSLSLGTAYTWSSIETRRSVNVTGASGNLRQDYDANTFQIFGELGYAVQAGEAYLEPFVGLAYVDVHTDSFTEDGGGAALSAQSDSDSTTLSTLGVRASSAPFKLGTLSATANGTLAWQHAFGDPSPTSTLSFAGGGPFTVQGAPIARNAALVEAGLTALLRSDLRLGVFYTGQFGDGATYQGARANLHWTF